MTDEPTDANAALERARIRLKNLRATLAKGGEPRRGAFTRALEAFEPAARLAGALDEIEKLWRCPSGRIMEFMREERDRLRRLAEKPLTVERGRHVAGCYCKPAYHDHMNSTETVSDPRCFVEKPEAGEAGKEGA